MWSQSERNPPSGLVLLWLDVASAKEALLADSKAIRTLFDIKNWEANSFDPVVHGIVDIDSGRLRDGGPKIVSAGIG